MSGYQPIVMTSFGASDPITINFPLNANWQAPPAWSIGLIATVSNGASLTYSVQVTADPHPTANGNWNNHDYLANLQASANSNIYYPVTGIRLNLTAYASGSVTLGICQWP